MNNILSKIIKHASENVPFYRELYSKNKVDISVSDNQIEDIKKIPIVKKQFFLESDYSTISKVKTNEWQKAALEQS